MNFCSACRQDFSSVEIFDRHRVGPHDGERRCLGTGEMEERGWRRDRFGRWHDPERASRAATRLRPSPQPPPSGRAAA